MKLELSDAPDGFGYFYGQAVTSDGVVLGVNLLPPRPLWKGDVKPTAIDPNLWVVYVDGDEIARVGHRGEAHAAVEKSVQEA